MLTMALTLGALGCSPQRANETEAAKTALQTEAANQTQTTTSALQTEAVDQTRITTEHLQAEGAYVFTDALGYQVSVTSTQRVVALYGSFAGTWLTAGGTIVGTTQDAVEERRIGEDLNPAIVGTVKEPNLEAMLALNPDFVLLSSNIESHVKLHESLSEMGIAHGYFEVETFEDYLEMLKICTEITGHLEFYETDGLKVAQEIEKVKAESVKALESREKAPTVLLLRAFSTGAKAKTDDVIAGAILKELGADNIAAHVPSMLEELSLEEIIIQDPDYIFVVFMGSDEDKIVEGLKNSFTDHPAWTDLTAVKNQHYIILPKDLFHYKPNERWGESYDYLAKILYPEIQ